MVSQIRAILADPGTARARAEAGYRHVMAHYTWEEIARSFEATAAPLTAQPAR